MRLHDFLEYRARTTANDLLVSFGDTRLTCADLDRAANQIAHALLADGVERGDRIGALAKNCPELLLLYYGASKVGAVLVPLNYRLAPSEWRYILDDAGVRLLVARGDLVSAVDPIRSELRGLRRCLAIDAELAGWESWDGLLSGHPRTSPDLDISQEGELYQMYTSGTTGRPKGAILSQNAVCSNVVQEFPIFGVRPGDRALVAAPLYHSAAAVLSFATVAAGGSLVIHEEFDAAAVVDDLSGGDIAVTLLVPAMIQFCLAVSGAESRHFGSLRTIAYGASPISEAVLRQAMQTFGCEFAQGYGLTETTTLAAALLPSDHVLALQCRPEILRSCGRPALGTEIRVVDGEGAPVPPGAAGEILVRGPQLMNGYWNLPEETSRALRDGWLHTGDVGTLDRDGYLYLKDRLKDMIVSGGENVYPREVEDVLFRHPAVMDAAVVGIPSDRWGETVHAVVVLRDGGSIEADELIAHCRRELASYKRPGSIEFVTELPRNPSGKVLKRQLRERHWTGHERRVN